MISSDASVLPAPEPTERVGCAGGSALRNKRHIVLKREAALDRALVGDQHLARSRAADRAAFARIEVARLEAVHANHGDVADFDAVIELLGLARIREQRAGRGGGLGLQRDR